MAEDRTRPASFEDSFQKKSLTHGRLLINQLAILIKVAQMHDLKNVAVEKAAETLVATLGHLFEDRKGFAVYLIGDYFFLEDSRIKYNVEDFNNFDFLVAEFKKRKLGALSFNSGVSSAEMIAFASVFLKADTASEEVYHDLVRQMGDADISGLAADELKPPKAERGFEKVVDAVKQARRAYIRVVLGVKELFDAVESGQPADIKRLKRALQSLVDSVYKSEPTLVRLTAVRRPEDVLPRHYVNVCVLSLLIGKRLGLSKYQMARLGMAALLHDMGRHGLPDELLSRKEDDEAALEPLMRHPVQGVETLLKLKGLNELAVTAMIVAYEHHRNMDGTGYPAVIEKKEMNLFSRIVRIADNYDASTSSGIYGMIPMPPEKAVALMLKRSGSYYDHDLLELFTDAMGVYPVGSLLLLSDNSMAVSCDVGGSLDRPVVMVIYRGGGETNEVVDLSKKDEGGNYPLDILKSLDPHQLRINIYKYLV